MENPDKNKQIYTYLGIFIILLPILLFRDFGYKNGLRYLSIADEALKNGHFFFLTNHGIPYADKPPLFFWIIMFGKKIFGIHSMFYLSLCSLIPAFITTYIMDRWTAPLIDNKYHFASRLVLLTSGLFLGMSFILRMDMLMTMFITLSLYTFYKMLQNEGNTLKHSLLFPIYIFLAVFTKGPMGFLIPFVSTIFFLLITRRIRKLNKFWGWKTWSILIIGFILWFVAAYSEGGETYLYDLLFHQTIGRAFNSFHHAEPFYYYFDAMWYIMLPWSIMLIGTLLILIFKGVKTDLQKYFGTIIATTFILLSLISAKLQVYILPIFPFIVYLTMSYISKYKWNKWLALSLAVPNIIFCTSFFILKYISHQEKTSYLNISILYIAAIFLMIIGLISLYLIYHKKNINYSIQTMAIGLCITIFIGSWSMPKLNNYFGYENVCEKAKELANNNHVNTYYTWKLSRSENMDVYLGQDVKIIDEEKIVPNNLKNVILITKNKNNINFVDKKQYIVGPYSIILL